MSKHASLALVLLVACTSHPRDSEYDDLAKVVGAGIATPDDGGDLGAITDSALIARGIVPDGFTSDDIMTRGRRWGVSYDYLVMCRAGATPVRCGPAADLATVVAWSEGELSMPDFTARLRRQGTWTLTNIPSPIVIATGATSMMEQDVAFLTRAYHMTDDATLQTFVDMARRHPMGGSMTREIAVTRVDDGRDLDWAITAEITIDSPETATLTLDQTFAYEVDLATGEVTQR